MRRCTAVVFIFCALCLNARGSEPLRLPADPLEAAQWLADGQLDSAVWEIVAPWYTVPLCVPCGDLAALVSALPGLYAIALPDSASLAGYEPWSPEKRRKFFTDFPDIAALAPVLTFDASLNRSSFALRAGLKRYADERVPLERAAVHANVGSFSFKSTAHATDSSIVFSRRSLETAFGRGHRVIAGNYAVTGDDGLLLGRFERDTAVIPAGYGLAYGGSAGWNGLFYEYSPSRALACRAFAHVRPTEQAAGIRGELRILPWLSCKTGLSAVAAAGPGPAVTAGIHNGLLLSGKRWRLAVNSCIVPGDRVLMPLSASLDHRTAASSAGIDYWYLPAGPYTRFSRIAGGLSGRLDDEDTLTRDVQAVSLTMRSRLTGAMVIQPSFTYAYSAVSSDARFSLGWSVSRPADITITYTAHPDTRTGVVAKQYILADGRLPGDGRLTADWSYRWYRRDGYGSAKIRLGPCWRPVPGLAMHPWAQYHHTGQTTVYSAGMSGEVIVSGSASSAVTVGVPVAPFTPDRTLLYANMSFSL